MTSLRGRESHGLTRDRLALEIRRARAPFIVLIVLLVGALVAGAVIARNIRVPLPWQDRYTAQVAVDDAKGVVPGQQEVRISGVPVGRIEKLELVRGRSILTISMDGEDGPIFRNARARLRPRTPLQDLYLNIEDRGDASAGELGEDAVLATERTRTPVDIGRILNTFNADTRTRMEQAIDELGRGLDGRGDRLRAALVELGPFLRAAQRLARENALRQTQTRRLVHNFRLMTEELAGRDRQLTRLVRAGGATFTELASVDDSLDALIAGLPPTLQRMRSAFATLRVTADELDPAFTALQPTARALPAGMRALRDFSVDARPALGALRPSVRELAPLARALRPTAAGLNEAFSRLRPQAPRLNRITAELVPCLLAVQKFFHHTLSIGKFYDEISVIGRVADVVGTGVAGGQGNVKDVNARKHPSCADQEGAR